MMNVTRVSWLAPLLVGLLALGVRLLHLDKPAHFDELYHLLAGQSWLAEGTLRIAEGTYNRTALFTIYLAGWMALLGESLVAVRLPSVLAGVALVVAVFLWTRRVATPAAAWIAAVLLALWRDSILIDQFARFYALHALMFWLGAIACFRLVSDPPAGRVHKLALGLGALLALAVAFYLQALTAIGLAGLGVWLALVLALRARGRPLRQILPVGLGLAGLGLVALGLLVATGLGRDLLATFREVPAWNAGLRNAVWYYHLEFVVDFPSLWPLLAVAVLVGLGTRPAPTGFCAVVFGVAFVLHSLAASKGVRYIYWSMPFLFVLWAIALADVWPRLWRFLGDAAARALPGPGGRRRAVPSATLAVVLLVTLGAQGAVLKSLGTFADTTAGRADWAGARAPLQAWLREADVVITSSELEALHYLGRYDFLLSKSRLDELHGASADFDRDPRTGRPVITTAAAMARVLDCFDDGLVVSSDSRWRDAGQVDDAVANLIATRTERLGLDARAMRAYVWRHPGGAPGAAGDCADLPAPAPRREPGPR